MICRAFVFVLVLTAGTSGIEVRGFHQMSKVKELVEMVVKANRLEPGKFDKIGDRAGKAAWLPLFEIRVDRNIEDDRSGTRSRSVSVTSSGVYLGPDDETYVMSTDDDWRIRVRAVWELDRLVYDRDELKAAEKEMRAADIRLRIIEKALKAYLDMQIAMKELERKDMGAGKEKLYFRIQRNMVLLDSLTGGAFSAWYSSFHKPIRQGQVHGSEDLERKATGGNP